MGHYKLFRVLLEIVLLTIGVMKNLLAWYCCLEPSIYFSNIMLF